MVKHYSKTALIVIFGALLISCAAQKPQTIFQPYDFSQQMQGVRFIPKVDDFLVVLDASASMEDSYKGQAKVDFAREIVSRMNQTIPDIKLSGGLRTFGRTINPFSKSTALIYGMTDYSRQQFDGALQTVTWASGTSPMAMALDKVEKDLEAAKAKSALIVVSDGKEMDNAPLVSAQRIQQQFGDMICIYTVLVGDDPAGKTLLENIAKTGQCGFSVTADQIYSSEDMADFVEKVFLAQATAPLDSDGDGVTDDRDQCPDTPDGVQVDALGCPLDTDGDGVYDYLDKCPGTPLGAKVDARGCWVLKGVMFDTAKSDIKPISFPILDEVVAIMKKNPGLKVEVQGHTDNQGAEQYNLKLSESRARSVMEYLVKEGVEQHRLSFVGYGFSKPAASNATAEGRAQNRRVQLKPIF
jgi:OOP family OmpA-OmpF porin